MLGLRAETDDSSKLTAQRVQPRSYRFAGRLAGRFNVAGVSGGLEKHTRELQELEMRKARVEARRTYVAPLLQKKQKQDLINDAKRLVELEESLREIQRLKELRARRDQSRKRRKLEFQSAVKLQLWAQRWKRRRMDRAADRMLSFLRFVHAKQALATAAWAAKVIRNFAVKASIEFQERKLIEREVRNAALLSWEIVTEVACQWTAARRAVADEFLFKCVGTAKQQATSKLLELMAARRARRMQRKQRKLAKARRRKINGGSSEAYQQFFLTEFETYGKSDDSSDWGSDSSSDWDSDDSSNSTSSPSQKRKFVNAANVPGGACPPAIHSEKVSSSATSLVSATRDLAACTFRKEPKHKKVYDENDAKARRIIELHKAKVARMENEKLRRLNTIEKRKVKEEQRETVEQIKEVTHVLTKEKSKREFMEKVELERLQRARIIAKRREEKQKQIKKAQQDAKNEQLERYAMRREDELWFRRLEESRRAIAAANLKALSSVAVTNSIKRSASNHNANINEAFIRVGSNSRPSTAGRLKPPLPSTVPTVQSIVQPAVQLAPPKRKISYAPSTKVISANEQALEEKAQEALNAKWVKFSSAEAIARSRAATKRRIAAKLANKVVKEKEEEEREKQKKEKVLQLAAIARANLQRAVALRNKRRRQASKKTRVVTQSTSNSASNSPQKDSSSQNSPIRQTAKQTVVKSPPKTEENEEDDAEEDDMDGFLEGEAFSEFLNTAPFNYEEFFASPKVIDLLRFSAEAKRISTAEGFGLAPMEHASCEELGERNCERNGEDAEEEYGKDELEAVNSFAGAFEELYQNITGFSEKQMIKKTMIQDDSNDVNDSKSTGRTIPEDQSKHLSSDQTTSNSSNAGRVGKAKKIPMILQSTPYFGHYKKFENKPLQEYLKESVKEARQVEQQRKAHKRRDIEEAQAADSRQWSDVTNMDAHKPMYPSKEFPRRNTFDSGQDTHLQLPSDHGARSNSLDGDLLDYQQQHKKSSKVASLLEMVAKARRKLNEDSDAAPLVAPVKNSHHSTTTDHKGESSNRASQIQIQRSTPPMQPSLFGTPLPPLVSHADNSNKIDIASGNTSGIHSGGIGGIGSSTTTDFFRAFGSSSKPSLNASAGFYGTKSKSKKKKKNSTSKKASNMDTADDIRSENVAVNSNVGGNIGNSTINAGQPEAQGLKRTSSDVLPKHSLPLPKAPPRVMRGNAAVRAKNGASTTESVNTTSSQLSRSSSESKSIGSSINPNVISRSSRYNTVQEESDEADSDDSFEADLAEENEDSKEMLAAELAYEEQLQRDYVNLKAQFDEKLQLAENMHSQDDQNESIPGTALLTEAVTVADPNTIPRVYSSQYDNKLTPAQLLAQWANEDAMVVEGEEEHDYQEEREGESIGEDDDASYQCKAGSEVESESQLELRMRACNNSMKATIFDEDSEEEDEMALIRSTRNKTRNVSMEHKRDLVDNSVVAAMVGAATMENVGIGGLTLHDDECEKMLQQLHSKITNR